MRFNAIQRAFVRLGIHAGLILMMAWSTAAVLVAGDNSRFEEQSVPLVMAPGESRRISITMTNLGTVPWTRSLQYKLGSQNPQDNRIWGLSRVELTDSDIVYPGRKKTFAFNVTAPSQPGRYDFQWRMLREHIHWFGEFTRALRIHVKSVDAATFVSQSMPRIIAPGERREVSVTMHNAGSTRWTRSAEYKLGSRNPRDNTVWGLSRVHLPDGVEAPPGHDVTFKFIIKAPPKPGYYNFQWKMLREHVHWFGQASPNVRIFVTSTDVAQFVSQQVPSIMRPGRSYPVKVTMRNIGTTSWTRGEGFKLGSQNPQDNTLWGLNRVPLAASQSLSPGQTVTFAFTVKAPTQIGYHNFQWRMVKEGVHWFGQFSANRRVYVGPPLADPQR